ncbi:prepilin-type N-terminal cleavage/methylation domain-containing protein [Parelusimicrobium proximum]|uniref:type IV pilin protein n=1 Tax=Parelusimicrobium proximum TaxID=3228953 RepID=UPI003D168312
MKKGFTLIELLVVVLIIAILAAVALPQYTSAVEKARATEALITIKSMADAVERANLQAGENVFTNTLADWDKLDVSFPSFTDCAAGPGKTSGSYLYVIEARGATRAYKATCTGGTVTQGDYDLMYFFDDVTGFTSYVKKGGRLCVGRTAKGKAFCQSMGGVLKAGVNYVLP